MPKRSKAFLENIKNFVDSAYGRFGNLLHVDTSGKYDPLDPNSQLGYCYKFSSDKRNIYKIVCRKTGLENTDFRILMHEYGHIYLSHLDGIHEELDIQICNLIKDNYVDLVERINKSCGIDFADKLLNRVVDDPYLNHQLHNIAMDMEVNSKVLSEEDVNEMEADLSSLLPKIEEDILKHLIKNSASEEEKKKLSDTLKQVENSTKVKLMVPSRYHLSEGDTPDKAVPFPDGLTYAEYLMLIIEHLDQFVKMLVSINAGGNGDTSGVTMQDIQNAMNNWNNQSEEYKKGYQDAMNDIKENKVGRQENNPDPSSSSGMPSSDAGADSSSQGSGSAAGSSESGAQASSGSSGGSGSDSGSASGSSGEGSGKSDYQKGYEDALRDAASGGSCMSGLNSLMAGAGMGGSSPYKGTRPDEKGENGAGDDHRTDSRDAADKDRKEGKIKSDSGGVGCGSSGGADGVQIVNKDVDEVEMALKEVLSDIRHRVVKRTLAKDVMKLYNRGVVRSVIAPTVTQKILLDNEPKIVYLIDISGSMNSKLIDRILKTIAVNMRKLNRGLKYDIITWNTGLGEHIKDIDPKKGVPTIKKGGGTRLAKGIQYFKDNYQKDAILVVISDFEDYLEEWCAVESKMSGYSLWGFNYGGNNYGKDLTWKNMKLRYFTGR